MFNASSVDEDGLQTVQEVKEQLSKAGRKEVVYTNTRFPPLQYLDDPGPVPPSPSLNTDIIVQRGIRRAESEATTEFAGTETPRVNGYAFVEEDEPEDIPRDTPSAPSYRDLLAGQAGDGTPNPFTINEIRKREDLHLRMVEKQARRQREKGRETIRTPTSFNGDRTPAGNMTPAARKLLERLGGNTPKRPGRQGVERSARGMNWTPGRTPRKRLAGR